jgi:hypothetical protein
VSELKLYLAIGMLLAWIVTGVGAFAYRGHLAAGEIKAARDDVTLAANTKAGEVATQTLRDERALQARSDVLTQRLQDRIDATKDTYERARLQFAMAHVPSCPIPLTSIGLLALPGITGTQGGQPGPAGAPVGSANAQGGTVDAGEIVLNAEFNKLAFERNRARLETCIDKYDSARTVVNGPSQ